VLVPRTSKPSLFIRPTGLKNQEDTILLLRIRHCLLYQWKEVLAFETR
jgi:hypothetical protein